MSIFSGQFVEEELAFIRADNFLPRNHSATVFLLSHLHTDHTQGLGNRNFRDVLEGDVSRRLFCSSLSREMLLKYKWCQIAAEKIVGLNVNEAFTVNNPASPGQQVTITPLPAGHCPGSVMFLIESEKCRVLYTGDLRVTDRELRQFRSLHFHNRRVKPIDHLYLDMTFCTPEYRYFPARIQTEAQIKDLVTSWLQADTENKVALLYNSYFGLECLLIELAKNLASKIYVVEQETLDNYRIVPELRNSLTGNSHARVHLCPVPKYRSWKKLAEQSALKGNNNEEKTNEGGKIYGPCPICLRIPNNHLKTIKPCAMSFRLSDKVENPPQLTARNGLIRVPYSCHASLSELGRMVWYLNPARIFPCAIPESVHQDQCIDNLRAEIECQEKEGEFDDLEQSFSVQKTSDNSNCQKQEDGSRLRWVENWVRSADERREEERDVKRTRWAEEEDVVEAIPTDSDSTGEEVERAVPLQSQLDIDSPPL